MNISIQNNKLRAISNSINSNLKKNNINIYGLKKRDIVLLWCELNDIDKPNNIKLNKWLISIWDSKDFNLLSKISKRDYSHSEWIKLRKLVLYTYGEICLKCGSKNNIHIDHIKPYSKYPELALDFNNVQPLCKSCNSSKGNRNCIDYRKLS